MKRYDVCLFPSLYGTPWSFASRRLAILAAMVRGCFGLRFSEVRVIDNLTGDHIYVL